MSTDRPAVPDEGGDPPCWAHLVDEAPPPVDDGTLAELVEQLADAVVIADVAGTIIFWNGAAERLFGWNAAEATGRTLDIIIPERLRDRHRAGWRNVMNTGVTKYGETLLEVPAQRRDGQTLSIAFTVTLLRENGSSHVSAVAAVLRDDTARWQERREQRDEISRLRADPGPTRAN